MKSFLIAGKQAWKVLGKTPRTQAAEMVIKPGGAEGGPDNKHPRSDQWLLVLAGRGIAVIEGRKIALSKGRLLLIEKGERHQILATGRAPLRTINLYGPPAY